MKIKITALFLLLATVFIFLVFKGNYFNFSSKETKKVEEVMASDIKANLFISDLKDYAGNKIIIDNRALDEAKAVIVHLWASWCAPCVNEVPELIEFAKKNPDIKYVIISADENKEDIAKFLKSFPEFNAGIFIKVWDANSSLSKMLNSDRLPMTIILRKGVEKPDYHRTIVDWKKLVI